MDDDFSDDDKDGKRKKKKRVAKKKAIKDANDNNVGEQPEAAGRFVLLPKTEGSDDTDAKNGEPLKAKKPGKLQKKSKANKVEVVDSSKMLEIDDLIVSLK